MIDFQEDLEEGGNLVTKSKDTPLQNKRYLTHFPLGPTSLELPKSIGVHAYEPTEKEGYSDSSLKNGCISNNISNFNSRSPRRPRSKERRLELSPSSRESDSGKKPMLYWGSYFLKVQ